MTAKKKAAAKATRPDAKHAAQYTSIKTEHGRADINISHTDPNSPVILTIAQGPDQVRMVMDELQFTRLLDMLNWVQHGIYAKTPPTPKGE